jgi:photosystem II stability/assembly factor-like uncharacterized protein
MGIREELNEALQVDDFPSSSLLAQTMMRLDEPAPAAKRWQAVAGVAAVLLAGFAVGAIRFAHVGHHPIQPSATSQPAVSLASAQEGLMSYRFVTPQVGWVSVFRPDGQTVVGKTSDGGKHWKHQLQIDWVYPAIPAQFLNPSVGVIGGQQQGIGPEGSSPTTLPAVLWVTTDGGAHWEMRTVPPDSGSLMSFDFIDAAHGWLLTSQGSTVVLYQTLDGGRHWTGVASSETSPGLAKSGGQPRMKFVSPTIGWMSNNSLEGSAALYVTGDGGRTWRLENRPAAGVGKPGSRVSMNLPAFFNERDGIVAVTLTSFSSPSACPSAPPSGARATCGQPPATYVSLTSDGGQTWSAPRRLAVDGTVSFIDTRRWIARGASGLSTTDDAGVSWSAPRPLPQLPAGWGPNQVELLDLQQGWMSVGDWPEGEARRIAIFGSAAAGSTGPMHIRISGTPPKFALLATDDGGAHWTEVQLAGLD